MDAKDSLYECARKRILGEMLDEVGNTSPYFLLVADKHSLKLLGSMVTVLDLTQKGVSVIESLDLERKSLPTTDVLYLVQPSNESINRILRDFEGEPCYNVVHLFSVTTIPTNQMQKLAQSAVSRHIVTLKELNLDYKVVGLNAFSLEKPGILNSLYMRKTWERADKIRSMAKQLADLCICIGQFPSVRYYAQSNACQELALALEEEFDNRVRVLPDVRLADTRPTFVIVDRSFDLATGLAHSIGYEAMLQDLAQIGSDGSVVYNAKDNANNQQRKQIILNEEDKIWSDLRYLDINIASDKVQEKFREFQRENRELEAVNSNKLTDVKQVAKVVGSLTNYQTNSDRYAAHFDLIDRCMGHFDQSLAEVEQKLLTGLGNDLKEVSASKLADNVAMIMPTIQDPENRLRLALLACVCIQLNDKDTQKIASHLTSDGIHAIRNLYNFGLKENLGKNSEYRFPKEEVKRFKERVREVKKIFNYAIPKLTYIIEDTVGRRLSTQDFPAGIKGGDPGEEAKSQGVSVRRPNRARTVSVVRSKFIIFVLGGLSYAEIRLADNHPEFNVILGGSAILTPSQIANEMAHIESEPQIILNF